MNILNRNFCAFLRLYRLVQTTSMSAIHVSSSSMKKAKTKPKCRYPPGEIYLCILGNGSLSSPRALYMFTDHQRYLFNCGEGTQRLAQEYKMKLSKLNHVFITYSNWENLGGLLGLSLTTQDAGVSQFTVHGPPGIASLYKQASSFVFLNQLNVVTKEPSDDAFVDDCMTVQYIPIFRSSSSDDDADDSFNGNQISDHKAKKVKLNSNSLDMTVSYACKCHSKAGQLMFDKCVELGVPTGPLLAELKNGRDITLPSGKVILSKEVVSPEQVSPPFLVVECPSEDFVSSFVSEPKFATYQKGAAEPAELVVHFTSSAVIKSNEYQNWMKKFPSSTLHLLMNHNCSTLSNLATHRLQYKLNLLHPRIFSLLHEREEKNVLTEENITQARTLDRYFLRPAKGFDRSVALSVEPQEYIQEAHHAEGFVESLTKLQQNISQSVHTNTDMFPEVVFLGTGSCIPSKVRNVSSILINIDENESVMLDCGEGTYGQLCKLNTLPNLSHLKCIFISHMHADHHLGLLKILLERELSAEPLEIVGPKNLNSWLTRYFQQFESFTPSYRFIECSSLEQDLYFGKQTSRKCGNVSISTVAVQHCPDAYAVILSSDSSWKIVYSGDTMPCQNLIAAGKNCSLLIHEATMEDELKSEAEFKRHSTTSQAIQVGEAMKAEYTLLTHFSQRYAKIPLFNESFHNRVGCAFDNMKVRPSELHILPLLIPVLKTIFADEVEELHTKGNKRRKKLELLNAELKERNSVNI